MNDVLTFLKEFQFLIGIVAAIIAFGSSQLAAYIQARTATRNVERQLNDSRARAYEDTIRQQGAFATAIRSACYLLFYHAKVIERMVTEPWFPELRGRDREAQLKLLKFYIPAVLNSPWRDFSLLDADVHEATAELVRDIIGTNELLDFSRVHNSSDIIGLIIDSINAVCTGTEKVRNKLAAFLKAHPEIKVGFDPGAPP